MSKTPKYPEQMQLRFEASGMGDLKGCLKSNVFPFFPKRNAHILNRCMHSPLVNPPSEEEILEKVLSQAERISW